VATTSIQATVWWSKGLIVAYSFTIDVVFIGGLLNAIRGKAQGVSEVLG